MASSRSVTVSFECEIDITEAQAVEFVNSTQLISHWALHMSTTNRFEGMLRLNHKTAHSVIEKIIRQGLGIHLPHEIQFRSSRSGIMHTFLSLTTPKSDTRWIVCSEDVAGRRKRRRQETTEENEVSTHRSSPRPAPTPTPASEPPAPTTDETVPEPRAPTPTATASETPAAASDLVEPPAPTTEEIVPEPPAPTTEETVPEPPAPTTAETVPEPPAPTTAETVPEPPAPTTEETVPEPPAPTTDETVPEPPAPAAEEVDPERAARRARRARRRERAEAEAKAKAEAEAKAKEEAEETARRVAFIRAGGEVGARADEPMTEEERAYYSLKPRLLVGYNPDKTRFSRFEFAVFRPYGKADILRFIRASRSYSWVVRVSPSYRMELYLGYPWVQSIMGLRYLISRVFAADFSTIVAVSCADNPYATYCRLMKGGNYLLIMEGGRIPEASYSHDELRIANPRDEEEEERLAAFRRREAERAAEQHEYV
jgi:chemotaxis protein histidine kinase CheA